MYPLIPLIRHGIPGENHEVYPQSFQVYLPKTEMTIAKKSPFFL